MNADPYSTRQRERDSQYRREYAAWVNSLSEEERRQLKEQGLDVPSIPGAASGMADAASSSRARCEAADIEEVDENGEPPADHEEQAQAGTAREQASSGPEAPQLADAESIHDLLRRLVGELVCQDNAKLSLECLALVTGLTYEGASMTEIAARYGVTRAAVSKRCVELTTALNLNPSRAMRTRKARQSYRQSRTLHLRSHA